MSTGRGLKRRTLHQSSDHDEPEEAHQNSPIPVKKQKSATTYGRLPNKNLPSSSAGGGPGKSVAKNVSAATEAWIKAKAKVRARVTINEADLYNDIEGANNAQTRPATLPRPLKRLPMQKSLAKTLDPLRNQKSQENLSPRKQATTSTGFFKQFRKKNKDDIVPGEKQIAGLAKEKGTNGQVNGPIQSLLADGEEWDDNADQDEMPESEEVEVEATTPRKQDKLLSASEPKATGAWKGFVYGKPKKTFEDEIRELAETAAQKAQEEDSEDELASGEKSRRSSRKPVPKRMLQTLQPQPKSISSPIVKSTKVLDRRKAEVRQKSRSAAAGEGAAISVETQKSVAKLSGGHVPRHSIDGSRPSGEVSTPQKRVEKALKKIKLKANFTFESENLCNIQRVLLEKVTGRQPIALQNLDDEYAKVRTMINQTVTAGESNSMLLVGSRGSGKTALVNQILREEAIKHPNDFHAIRLNGFIHTDDKIALREIWRQLGKEMELDDNDSGSMNYADTMSKLLALLSHPAEMGTEVPDQVTKSVIFVLDEFDLFCGHPRQMLLYNLFDIAQSRKAPIAVLGLTTRIDAADSLEKRVKSRFSHRQVYLSLPKSFQSFAQICQSSLSVDPGDLRRSTGGNLITSAQPVKNNVGDESEASSQWNALLEQVLTMEPVDNYLRRVYYTTKSVGDVLANMALVLATMPTETSTSSTLLEHCSTALASPAFQAPDSKLVILATLGTLQLALLVCAARLTNIYNTEIISFALVYEEYKVLASKARLQASASGALAQGAGSKIWGKDVAKDAWEELVDCGLILVDGRTGGTGRVDVGLEEIGASGVELGAWARWCKEI